MSIRRGHFATLVEHVARSFLHYYLGTSIVLLGVYFGFTFVKLSTELYLAKERTDFIQCLAAWDGYWYVQITRDGYWYQPEMYSSVAFFPGYPWSAQWLVRVFGLRTDVALLIVSHASLWMALAVLLAYVRARFPKHAKTLPDAVLIFASLFPTTFFLRMAYTESLFLLFCVLAMYGMVRSWHPLWIALVIGAATGTRHVGVALLVPFWSYLWEQSPSRWRFVARFTAFSPLACWGLFSFMAYLGFAFGDPLAFATSQAHWSERQLTLGERAWGLVTLEPFRAVYDPESVCYWSRVPPRGEPLLNLKFANPIYTLFAIAAVAYGWARRWIDRRELLLSAMLLLIPLWMQAGRMCMSSHARCAAVVFPVYIVLGHIAIRCGILVTAAMLAISAVLLCVYSAMFASWYWFY